MKKNKIKYRNMASVFGRENLRAARANRPTDPAPCLYVFTMHLKECYVETFCVSGRQYWVSTWENVFPATHTKCLDAVWLNSRRWFRIRSQNRETPKQLANFHAPLFFVFVLRKVFPPETHLPDFGYFFWRIFALFFPPQMGVEIG